MPFFNSNKLLMDRLFENLKQYIVKKIEVDQHKYHYPNMTQWKKYLVVYKNAHNNDIIGLIFPCIYEKYNPVSPGAYGDLFEGYDFNTQNNNGHVGGIGYYYGHYPFDFYELTDSFVLNDFCQILRQKYLFDMNYDSNFDFDSYETFKTPNIHIYYTHGYLLCSTCIEIESNETKYYDISFNGYAFEFNNSFLASDSKCTYDDLFQMEKFLIKIKEK